MKITVKENIITHKNKFRPYLGENEISEKNRVIGEYCIIEERIYYQGNVEIIPPCVEWATHPIDQK